MVQIFYSCLLVKIGEKSTADNDLLADIQPVLTLLWCSKLLFCMCRNDQGDLIGHMLLKFVAWKRTGKSRLSTSALLIAEEKLDLLCEMMVSRNMCNSLLWWSVYYLFRIGMQFLRANFWSTRNYSAFMKLLHTRMQL